MPAGRTVLFQLSPLSGSFSHFARPLWQAISVSTLSPFGELFPCLPVVSTLSPFGELFPLSVDPRVSTLSPFGELFPCSHHAQRHINSPVSTLSPFGELFP